MKTLARATICVCILLGGTTAAVADPVTGADVDRAQSRMLTRISEAVNRYAAEIKIDPNYIIYCQNDMYLRSFNHPANGHVPFGVNYNNITDSEKLKHVLSVREAYEKSFMFVCLANAKNALRAAARP